MITSARVSRFASVTEIIKYVEKLLLFACLIFLMSNGIHVPSEFFFPTSWSAVFNQLWRRSIFKFCVYKLAEAVRYLKFKWEFVIIGRGCLVLLKVQDKFVLADAVF